ncbi:site-specific DNA-methyltransferase [Candidatus Berkelbacteria bacterium]|nr:site-specific DNA-methyltransferase [Candidatus Berkelbacteria bacterium]
MMLSCLRDGSADIVFLDPPFNLGKTYGRRRARADQLEEDEYFRHLRQVLDRSASILKPGGALYLYHLPRWALRLAEVLRDQLVFRHWIAISMKNGFPKGKYLYPAHYALLYFTKGETATFVRPKVEPARCRHCGLYTKDYGGYARFVSNGVNLSDVWDDLSPVRHKRYKHRRSNELPMQIPGRVIEMSGRRNGLFVDPFAGSGTGLVSALRAGMRFVASERERENCLLMSRRLPRQSSPLRKGTRHAR